MLHLNNVDVIIERITLTVVYILTILAPLMIRSKIKQVICYDLINFRSLISKLQALKLTNTLRPRNVKFREVLIRIGCLQGLILSYLMLTIAYLIFMLVLNPLVGLIFLIVVVLTYLNTKNLIMVSSSSIKEITDLGNGLYEVLLVTHTKGKAIVRTCLPIGSKTSVIEGNLCSKWYVVNGVATLKNRVVVSGLLSEILAGNIVINAYLPPSLIVRDIIVKPKTIVKHRVSNTYTSSLSNVLKLESTEDIYEPTINYVRPYMPGDDIKLVVGKSILSLGGLRVKVLDRLRSLRVGGRAVSICLILDRYFCNYPVGLAQLTSLISLIYDSLGEVNVYIANRKFTKKHEVLSAIKSMCSLTTPYGGNLCSADSIEAIIASPEGLDMLIKNSYTNKLIITVRPLTDLHITELSSKYSLNIEAYQEWIKKLRENIETINRGVLVIE